MKNVYIILIAFCLLLSSCTSKQERSFKDIFPGISFNREITMEIDELYPFNTLSNGDANALNIINHTSNSFSFEPQDGGSIFYYDAEQGIWVEVKDTMTRSNSFGSYDFVPPKSGDSPGIGGISYNPNIPGMKEEMKLRFVVAGILTESNNEEKPVGAYLDLVISP
jgi:hypothetical protein